MTVLKVSGCGHAWKLDWAAPRTLLLEEGCDSFMEGT